VGTTTPKVYTPPADLKKLPKCRRKPQPKKLTEEECEETTYGCCADLLKAATGPFQEGCENPKTCQDTEFGCCPDQVTVARGRNSFGCEKINCKDTLFGCCEDGISVAQGNLFEGCTVNCNNTKSVVVVS